jgi:hypothetical protein
MALTNNVVTYNGQLYQQASPLAQYMTSPGNSSKLGVDYAVKRGWLKPLSLNTSQQSTPTYQRPQFTPNAFTQGQLAGMGSGAAPQWMMDAYTKKIGNMGGNANAPVPFNVTQSGFPGMGGKTAPAQGQ